MSSGATPSSATTALDFQWKIHAYVNDYIKFADAKAAVVIAWTSALIGALYAVRAHDAVAKLQLSFWLMPFREMYLGAGSAIAFVLLALGFWFAVVAIAPRLRPSYPTIEEQALENQRIYGTSDLRPVIFWKQIRAYNTGNDYWKATESLTDEQRLAEIGRHCWTLSRIVMNKYWWVGWSLRLAFFGSIAVAAVILVFPAPTRAGIGP